MKNTRHVHRWAGLLVPALLLLPSCANKDGQKPVFPVKGEVLYKGQAAVGAVVLLHPKDPKDNADTQAPRPHGRVAADGSFTLTTYRAGDGAPAGEYTVTIEWRQGPPHGQAAGSSSLLPKEYGSPVTSRLQASIHAGTNEPLAFRIES